MRVLFVLLGLVALPACRMGPELESPQIGPSEFRIPLGRAGTLRESDIDGFLAYSARTPWPVSLAAIEVYRDTRYAAVSQEEWDAGLTQPGAVRQVIVLDGLGLAEEFPDGAGGAGLSLEARAGSLFTAERWAAGVAGADLVFIHATKVASDTYWNYWFTSYILVVPIPFVPAQEQTVQAVSKGFLVDVRTGRILETAGAVSQWTRSANPILRTSPLFELEQTAVREAETAMIRQLAGKLAEMRKGR